MTLKQNFDRNSLIIQILEELVATIFYIFIRNLTAKPYKIKQKVLACGFHVL